MKKGRMTRIGCYGPNSGNIERCAECMAHDRSCSIGRHVEEEDTLNHGRAILHLPGVQKGRMGHQHGPIQARAPIRGGLR